MIKSRYKPTRREVIKIGVGGAGAVTLGAFSKEAGAQGSPNPIVLENQKAGTTAWQLSNPAANREIEGYASLTSVNRGGTIKFFVSTNSPSYTINIYRMGWYGGQGGRLVHGPISRTGSQQLMPSPDPVTGMVECNWTNPYILNVPLNTSDPTDWCSGCYLVKLTASSGKQSYILFVVRDDNRGAALLAQNSATTYHAYNTWGTKCLYNYLSLNGKADKVSLNRPFPYNPLQPFGVGAAEFLLGGDGGPPAGWEYCMVRFLEREGYDVAYCTNIDVHVNPNLLLNHKGFLSLGHDEYWSREMFDNVKAARDAGIHLGFFSANTCYWQVRLESSTLTGDANRTLVCYKYYPTDYTGSDTRDPLYLDGNTGNDNLITVRFRDTLPASGRVATPEETLLGTMYDYGADSANSDMVITNSSHWAFANTGLTNGSRLSLIVGYECDKAHGSGPNNLEILAHSFYTGNVFTGSGYSDMTSYTADSGATVFAVGTIQWTWGLDDWGVAEGGRSSRLDTRIQQITRNVLAKLMSDVVPPIQTIRSRPGGPYTGTRNNPVQFNGSASSSPNGPITGYLWEFGDGTTGTGATPTHSYLNPGTYYVRLTVTDSTGATNAAYATTTITATNRYAGANADSVFDVTTDQRYYYPPIATGDYVIPIPTQTDRFNQWFSAGSHPMDGNGTLTTPINLYLTFYARQTVNTVKLWQASWSEFPAFHSKDVRIYLRQTGGTWTQVAAGTLVNLNGQLSTFTFAAFTADEARIEVLSSYDTALYRAVGLAEVEFVPASGNQPPIANAGGPYTVDPNQPLQFNGTASYDPDGTISSYSWDFGDGNLGAGATPTHTYTTSGLFTVQLTVRDDANVASNATTTVNVRGRYANATADSVFDNTSDRRYYYPPFAVGDYIVPIPAPEDQFNQWFTAGNHPMDASGNLTTPINLYLTFWQRTTINTVRLNQTSWYSSEPNAFKTKGFRVYVRQTGGAWNLVASGTLTNTNGQQVEMTFAPVAADEARIEVISSYDTALYRAVGLSEVEFLSLNTNIGPTANPGGPYSANPNQAVNFNGTGSSDPDGTIVSYAWNFGDGTTGTGATPSHAYTAPGTYSVTLTVTDNNNVTGSATTTVTINTPPVANPGGPYTAVAGQARSFNGTASSDPNGTIVGYAWDFGDGTTGTGATPSHTYTSTGTFTLRLTVTDNNGATGTATTTVTVRATNLPPVANAGGPYAFVTGQAGTLNGSASSDPDGTIVSYAWNFGDGTTGTGATPSHTYTTQGTFTAQLTVTDDLGATATASATVTAQVNNPVSALSLSPLSVVGGNNSTGTVTVQNNAPAGGTVVQLSSNNPAVQVPATVTVPAGSRTATFPITTVPVTSQTTSSITASSGGASRSATLTVLVTTPQSLTVSPTNVRGGTNVTGTVTLTGNAPAGGVVVNLVSSNTNRATVPATVTVPAGQRTATFPITTKPVTSTVSVRITASLNGVSRSASITLTP